MNKKLEELYPGYKQFFAETGESMASANSIKGKCSQIKEHLNSKFIQLSSHKETTEFNGKSYITRNANNVPLDLLKRYIGTDGEFNALNAWLSKAIDAKNFMLNDLKKMDVFRFIMENESYKNYDNSLLVFNYEEKFTLDLPINKSDIINEDTILNEWSPNEYAKFILEEQKAIAIGKLIHKDQILHKIYNSNDLPETTFKELKFNGLTSVVPVTIEPIYKEQELLDFKNEYLKWHDAHKELESNCNYYKAKLKNELTLLKQKLNSEYQLELGKYKSSKDEFENRKNEAYKNHIEFSRNHRSKIDTENAELASKCEARRLELIKEVSELKIFIPEILREIKNKVNDFKI